MKCTHKEIGKPQKASAFLGKNRKNQREARKILAPKREKEQAGKPWCIHPSSEK
jgi:hypothetical protein